MRPLAIALVLAGCIDAANAPCGDLVCPVGKVCGPTNTCIDPDQVAACSGHADGDACVFGVTPGLCRDGVCRAQVCGDGEIVAPEQCEPGNLNGATCLTYGFYEPDGLVCGSNCLADTSACKGRCGDGIVNGPELCDTTPGDVFTCSEVGFDYGSVTCSPALCAPLYDRCVEVEWRSHPHGFDYPTAVWAPKRGESFIIEGTFYSHITGSATQVVPVPTGCGGAGIWSTGEDVLVAGSTSMCRRDAHGAWTPMPLPDGVRAERVWGTGPNDIYAAGSAIVHFDGQTWSTVFAPTLGMYVSFESIYGSGTGVIAAGSTEGGLAIFDGTSWSYQIVSPGAYFDGLWVSPSNKIYITLAGDLGVWNAGTWSTIPRPADAYGIQYTWGITDSLVFAYGSPTNQTASGIWAYDGTTWLDVEGPTNLSYFGGGPESLIAPEIYQRYWESWGYAWTQLYPTTTAVQALWAFSSANVLAFTSGSYVTIDHGVVTTSPAIGNVFAVWASDPQYVVAVGSGTLVERVAGTWQARQLPATIHLVAVWGEASNRAFAVGQDSSAGLGVIYASTPSGWQAVLTRSEIGSRFVGVWGSATAGTYAIGFNDTVIYHLAPGADPTQWTTIDLPAQDPVGVWGDDQRVIVSFSDRSVFAYAQGVWTQLPTHVLAAPTALVGDSNDVFGLSAPDLIHYDGATWDRVRLPATIGAASAVFAGHGAVAVGGDTGVVMFLRPQ